MGGWPSTTGNSSGGGRWNNEPDDDYDDEEDCDEGSYTPPISSYSHLNSRRDDMHYRNRCNFDLDDLRNETESDRDRLRKAVNEQAYLVNNLGRLTGKPYYDYSKYSDYEGFSQKYFGTETLADFAKPIVEPLAECQAKVRDFKQENQREMIKLSWLSRLPKVSERDHILISEGFILGPVGSHVINSRLTNESQYLWKTNLDDELESYGIVSSHPTLYSGTLSFEELENSNRLQEEYLELRKDMKEKEAAVIQCYHIFRPDRNNNNQRHWMEDHDTGWRDLDSRWADTLQQYRHDERWERTVNQDNPYVEIYNRIKNDYEEAVSELEKCEAEHKAFEAEYDKKRNKVKESWR
jgi:hypothetical protein